MNTPSSEVGRHLRGLGSDVGRQVLPVQSHWDPVNFADRLWQVSALQQRAAAEATHWYGQTNPDQPHVRAAVMLFASAAARLAQASADLGRALKAAAHLFDPSAAALGTGQYDALDRGMHQAVSSALERLSALSTDLLNAGHNADTGVLPLPGPPVQAARRGDLPPAAGEHEPRTAAARDRAPRLLVVAAPPAAGVVENPVASVLPFPRP